MLQDLRHAVRSLLASPVYTAVTLAVLVVSIGATTAIFSFVDGMLLRPLPYPHADRLFAPVSIDTERGVRTNSVSYADYVDWRRERDLFVDVALVSAGAVDITGGGEAERINALTVSEEFFGVTDVEPLAGRVLRPSDHAAGAPRVVVIGYALWQRRFAAASTIVGQVVRIGGVPTEIVGVLPPRATWPEDRELFLPLRSARLNEDVRTRRDNLIFMAIARLADGTTPEQAAARMRAIAARLAQEDPASRGGWSNGLVPLRESVVEPELRLALLVLLLAVAAVLLIACANLASLTLVRGSARGREIALRLALGAGRARLVTQLLCESLLLAAVGGTAGVALAHVMVDGLRAMVPADTPFIDQVAVDSRVLVAAALTTMATTVLFGVLPSLTASKVRVNDALKQGSRAAGASVRTNRVRAMLVVGQVASAVVLLVAAGLLVQSLGRLTSESTGVDLDRVLSGRVSLPAARYPDARFRTAFVHRVTEQLASAPGVEAAAVTTFLPAGGGGFGLGRVFLAEGWPEPPAGRDVNAMWTVVSTAYFRTLGIPLAAGRAFEDRDTAESQPVIIVSRTFARRAFGDANPLGRRIRSWRDENIYREIVGVAADVPLASLSDRSDAVVYVPYQQDTWAPLAIALRASAGPPGALAATLRRVVASIDPELAVSQVGTMSVFARESVARERVSTLLMSALALAALTLAALGLYGVLSSSVVQRRQELGVRLALGASPATLYRTVLARGLGLTLLGLVTGFGLAAPAARSLGHLLYATSSFDPAAFIATAVVLALVAFVACAVPARRAAHADPLTALKSE